MRPRGLDLIVTAALTVVAGGAIITGTGDGAVRATFSLLLVFVLPGYALTAAMFPRNTLGRSERAAFTIGLSLAATALGGFMLNWTPWGLQAVSWTILLSGIALFASGIAWLRRERAINDYSAAVQSNFKIALSQGALFSVAALVVVGAVVVAQIGALQQQNPGFTQLWILPSDEANSNTIRVGIYSSELTTVKYRLQIEAGASIIREWPSIELKPGERWENSLMLPLDPIEVTTIGAKLYRLDASAEVYRHVSLWWSTPGK